MAYIKNPYGRISVVDDEDLKKWLGQPDKSGNPQAGVQGFSLPTPQEINDFEAAQRDKIARIKLNEKLQKESQGIEGVYFITVTQGGKDGYGVASANLLKELQQLDVNISIENKGQKVALLFHNPYSLLRLEAPVRILYTMFESTKLPEDWGDYLESADKILVPSKWCQEVFKNCGFPSEVVPLGYNDDVFKPIERSPKRPQRKDFVFLHYNAFNLRKGFVEVFKAFVKEFAPTEPVKMIFKTNLDRAPLPISPSQYPNIEIITGNMSDEELVKLLGDSDCFVFPSRGEGFGMPPLEAMATGCPTIIPNAHGMTEYFNPAFMYEVKIGEECPGIYSRYKGQDVGKMFVSDVDDLARQMRYVYEHEEEALAKGKAAAFYVKQWTYKETAKKLKVILDEASIKPNVERPLRNILPLKDIA